MPVSPEQVYQQTLVVRSQIGDESAFAELLAQFGPRLLLFTQRMMQSSPAEVADLTQEIWVAIFRGLPGLHDPSKFQPWIFRIARDRIYREYRRRKISLQPLESDEVEESLEPEPEGVDTEQLHRCLGNLSPEHREALVLRYLEEMSYDDIARVTNTTLGTVRSRIFYARRALRKTWKEQIV